jgi:membrane protease YdiL (CAAX protease family)
MNIHSLLINQKESRNKFLTNAKKAVAIALIASAFILAMQLFLAMAVVVFIPKLFNDLYATTLGSLFIDAFVYLFSILSALLIAKLLFKKFLPKVNYDFPKRKAPKKPWLYICGSIGTGYIVNILINFCFPKFVERFSVETEIAAETPIEIFCTYVLFAFLPAIFEELIFRGVLLKQLLPK